jgi:cytochrome c553
MRPNRRLTALMAVLAGMTAGAAVSVNWNYAADSPGSDELLSTKKVMDQCYVGNQSLMKVVRRDLEMAQPDWRSAEKNVTEVIRLMSMLTRQKPPRGTQEAWNGLVEDYLQKARTLQRDVKEQKRQASSASLQKIASTCDECHDNHGIQ